MNRKLILDVVGTLLLVAGAFFAFLPHAIHVSAGFDGDESHLTHIITGTVLLVAGILILAYNNKAFRTWKK